MKKQPGERSTAFGAIVAEVMSDDGNEWMLDESMSFDVERVSKVPIRYRIIARGFLTHSSLAELNDKLKKNGCAGLYARSLWEASLIYAFNNGLSYSEWKKLQETCSAFREEQDMTNPYFRASSISMTDLRAYIYEGSADREALVTGNLTRMVEKKITKVEKGEEKFLQFLRDNVYSFSGVREITRYYFCKYLYFMLETQINNYAAALETGIGVEDTFEEICELFKGVTPLKRKKYLPEDAKAFLLEADISCGGIFDAFNRYYFEYVSIDWMHVLLEAYGNVNRMPASAQHTLAEHLRNYDPVLYGRLNDHDAIVRLLEEEEKKEELEDAAYSLDGNHGYQRNRVGENTIRKYIKGTLDIDRTTLVCFLLFFGSHSELREEDRITRERLSEILLRCGFPALRDENDFDYFVIQYLSADDPIDYLMQEVTNYAEVEENFYLYRVYKGSYSYAKYFEK